MLPNWLYGKSKSKLQEILGGGGGGTTYAAGDGIDISSGVISFDPETTPAIDPSKINGLDNDLAALAPKTAISNPNILHNPWFTVNQRGQSSYNADGYCIDRWIIAGTSADKEVKIVSDGLELKQNSSTTDAWVATTQYIAHDDLIIGKKYTISILYADGTIKSAVSSLLTEADSYTRFASTDMYQDTHVIFDYQGSGGYFLVGIQTKNTTIVDTAIRAVKLELGSISTLAMDTAPNYATELLKCQRYFVRIGKAGKYVGVGMGQARSQTLCSVHIFSPVQMRAEPTLTISGNIILRNGDNTVTSTSGNVDSYPANEVVLALTATGLTAGSPYDVFTSNNNSYIDLSAEL